MYKFFENGWDRFVFLASIAGLILLLLISLYRNYQLEHKLREYKSVTGIR